MESIRHLGRKAQTGIITALVFMAGFILIWGVALAPWIQANGEYMVSHNGLTGIEAWGYSNINLFILFGVILGFIVLGFSARGGG